MNDTQDRFIGIFIFRDYSGLQERISGHDLSGVMAEIRDTRCRVRIEEQAQQQCGLRGVLPIDLEAGDYDKLAAGHRDYLRRLARQTAVS